MVKKIKTIGVFAPSCPVVDRESRIRLKTGIAQLEKDGFDMVLAGNLFLKDKWNAGSILPWDRTEPCLSATSTW